MKKRSFEHHVTVKHIFSDYGKNYKKRQLVLRRIGFSKFSNVDSIDDYFMTGAYHHFYEYNMLQLERCKRKFELFEKVDDSYRAFRVKVSLPCHGQRTQTNAGICKKKKIVRIFTK